MDIIIRAAAAAVVGSTLALLLRKNTPDLSLVLTIATGLVIVWIASSLTGEIVMTMKNMSMAGGVSDIYLAPVMKCVGIGIVTHMSAQICRDAQQSSTASAVELCGTLCALYAALPLIQSLLATVEKLV